MLTVIARIRDHLLRRELDGRERALPPEVIPLRAIGIAFLVAFAITSWEVHPRPALHGRGLLVLGGFLLLVASIVVTRPTRVRLAGVPTDAVEVRRTVLGLTGVIAGTILLALEQPNGMWEAGPYLVAIIAATRLDRREGALLMLAAIGPLTVGALIDGSYGTALSTSIGVLPWYLVMRLMRSLRERHEELLASRAAEARAAVSAERGRIAREIHDVLAHSLSALALQLESTRLLARDRNVDPEVARALDQAHSLAASGLDDARRAIAAARGDELPGPERLEALAGAFGDQSGLPVAVVVHGSPRQLAPDARLAVYRTAQEALTNVRRHAAAERVRLSLDYLPDSTVLVVEDHGAEGTPPPVAPLAGGYGLTGMRERAKLLGGELIASPTSNGFRVELRLPA
ncbi:MAG TPA: histidine kinase [Solirubrobacteraceae bacterium]|jgi:signal transduction histidine kinase|nr:histidine kinase [Solirubrobacteraceae bacterium]